MANQKVTGVRRIIDAYGYSIAGFKACYQHEAAFRQEVFALVFLIPLGFYLGRTGVEKALLIGSLLLIPICELFNSAIEVAIDRFGSEPHELSGRAKDIGSATVFLAIVLATAVWVLVLVG